MTVSFFGSSDYCLPVLDFLKKNFDLKLVVTRLDKPVGRKQILTPSATKKWAQDHKIPVSEFLNVDCDLGIVADFGRIIPPEEFKIPKLGTFNIHFSKLPDLRGASPVQACLLRGDTTAWITIFQIEKTLDTGPILWQKEYPIDPTETAGELYTRLFQEVAKELPKILHDYSLSSSDPKILVPQSGAPSYCQMLTRQDGFVDWSIIHNTKYMIQTYNRFRAMTPWPGLWTLKDGKRMKILKCHLENEKLVLDLIQFEGKRPIVL